MKKNQEAINASGLEYGTEYNLNATSKEPAEQPARVGRAGGGRNIGITRPGMAETPLAEATVEAEPVATESAQEAATATPEATPEKPKTLGDMANERTGKLRDFGRKLWGGMKYLFVIDKAAVAGAKKVGRTRAELASKTVTGIERGIDTVAEATEKKLTALRNKGTQAKDRFFGRIRRAKQGFADSVNGIKLRMLDAKYALDERSAKKEAANAQLKELYAKQAQDKQQEKVNKEMAKLRDKEAKAMEARAFSLKAEQTKAEIRRKRDEIAEQLGRNSFEGSVATAAA